MIGMMEFEAQKKRLEDNFGRKFSAGQLELIKKFVNNVAPLEGYELDRVVSFFIGTKKSLPVPNDFLEACRSEIKRRRPSTELGKEERDPLNHVLCRDTGLVWKNCDGIPVVHSCHCDKGSIDEGLLRITKDEERDLFPFPDSDFKPRTGEGPMSKRMEERVNWLKSEKHMGRSFKEQMKEGKEA